MKDRESFFGRQELIAQLDELWAKRVSSLVTCRGRRRVGKSTLIEEFARRSGAAFIKEERDVTSCKIHRFRAWKKPPAKWRVTPALPARTRYIFVEISDISPNKLASIEEIEIH